MPYHVHTDLSNGTTVLDSVNKYKQYIDLAKSYGMKAMAFSEHGNIFEWLHKKEYMERVEFTCNECGNKFSKNQEKCDCGNSKLTQTVFPMKYIHGCEFYMTETLDEKVRDNWHIGLYARNLSGFKELNKLSSKSFNKLDNHQYYNPRISLDELISTSDNIIVTTACLGSALNSNNKDVKNKLIKFLSDNKHRCFLEVQHHQVQAQSKYNQYMVELSDKHNIPLIAGTDTHAITGIDLTVRKILQARKNTFFDNEDGCDFKFKSYDELVESYRKQNAIDEKYYLQAIENTNKLAEMVEEFAIDRSFKYPELYEKPMDVINSKLFDGYKNRKIATKENVDIYNDRIKSELEVYEYQNALNFLLLDEDIKTAMRNEGRYCGYSRGSVSGSLVAYLLGITEIDSIKYNLYFERFMNMERISLADIDTDWAPCDRDRVKEYVHVDMKEKFNGLHTAEIITFNTNALKGAIRDVCGGIIALKEKGMIKDGDGLYDLILSKDEIGNIAKKIDSDEQAIRNKHPELFKYIDVAVGVIMSIGSHPAGTIVSPLDLEEEIGTFYTSDGLYPISQINMKEVDSLNFVKLDILGLDNVEIINKTCQLANIDVLTPDNMDFDDEDVWQNIIKHPLGIFQFEADYAHSLLRQILSDSTINKIKNKYPDVKKLSLMSMANGAIRPAGDSYRDALVNGEFADNGHEVLNEAFAFTNNYVVYQEQVIQFLNKFCGYSLGKADMVRRGFAKKTGTEKFLPEIKSGFAKTMLEKYGMNKESSDELITGFVRVIEDASRYLFSLNHADPYSMIGFATGLLRAKYPMQFMASLLDINKNNLSKTGVAIDYMNNFTHMRLESAKFRKSRGIYIPDIESGIIYKGVGSIKNVNNEVGDKLYEMRNMKFNSFYDFLEVSPLDKTQIETLIKVDYFSEFGKAKKLLNFYEIYRDWRGKKTVKKEKIDEIPFNIELIKQNSHETEKQFSKIDFGIILENYFHEIKDDDFTIKEKIEHHKEYLGYTNIKIDTHPSNCYVSDVIINSKYKKSHPKLILMSLGSGKEFDAKIDRKYFANMNVEKGDLISIKNSTYKPIKFKDDETGEWKVVPNKKQYWITNAVKIMEENL